MWLRHSRLWFQHAECDFDTHEYNYDTHECDYDTHECIKNTHECDLYTHELNFNTMRVTLTRCNYNQKNPGWVLASGYTTRMSMIFTSCVWFWHPGCDFATLLGIWTIKRVIFIVIRVIWTLMCVILTRYVLNYVITINDVIHFKTNIYLKILDRPSRISTKLFLNFIWLFLRTLFKIYSLLENQFLQKNTLKIAKTNQKICNFGFSK
jgi:hypothetical protein